jgi:hypothetical protein
MRWPLLASVWIAVLLLAALVVLWLQIPDSHAWQFVLSVLSGCALLGLLLWFCCSLFSKVVGTPSTEQWWLRWVLVAAVIVVWWLLQMPIDKLAEHRELYAGYWTSRLPHWLRGARTYEHLLFLQEWVSCLLRLLLAGLLLPVAVSFGAGGLRNCVRQIVSVWMRWWYWVAVVVCRWLGFAISARLVGWMPGHGLVLEASSLALRLALVLALDVVLACFVLQLIAVAFRRVKSVAVN